MGTVRHPGDFLGIGAGEGTRPPDLLTTTRVGFSSVLTLVMTGVSALRARRKQLSNHLCRIVFHVSGMRV